VDGDENTDERTASMKRKDKWMSEDESKEYGFCRLRFDSWGRLI
jgi:ATP-dependent protease ClpP protease subunit